MPPEPASIDLAPPAFGPRIPGLVALATHLAFAMGAYAGAMAVALIPVGLFVGPHVLAGAAVHGVLAATLLLAGRGILRRSRRARWVLIAVSAVGMVAIPRTLATAGPDDRAGWIFFGLVAVYFAAMLGAAAWPSGWGSPSPRK